MISNVSLTTSLGLICHSHERQQPFRLRHKPHSKINLDYKIFCTAPRPIPSAQHRACHVYEQILARFMLIFLEIIQRLKMLDARFTL